MFGDAKSEIDKFYDYYLAKFEEEALIMMGYYESEEFEIDLVLGEKSEKLIGIRMMVNPKSKTDEKEEEEDEDILLYDLLSNVGEKVEGRPIFKIPYEDDDKKYEITFYGNPNDEDKSIEYTGAIAQNKDDESDKIVMVEDPAFE